MGLRPFCSDEVPPPHSHPTPQMAVVTKAAYNVCLSPGYKRLEGHARQLVATRLALQLQLHGARRVTIPPDLLPWGMLDRVAVHGDGGPDVRYVLTVRRMFGSKSTPPLRLGRDTCLTQLNMTLEGEGRHSSYKQVKEATGHELRYRMVPACTVLDVTLDFAASVPPPAEILVEFWGANVLADGASLADAVMATRAGKAPAGLLFPHLSHQARMASAALTQDRLRGEEEEAAAGAPSTAAAAHGPPRL